MWTGPNAKEGGPALKDWGSGGDGRNRGTGQFSAGPGRLPGQGDVSAGVGGRCLGDIRRGPPVSRRRGLSGETRKESREKRRPDDCHEDSKALRTRGPWRELR